MARKKPEKRSGADAIAYVDTGLRRILKDNPREAVYVYWDDDGVAVGRKLTLPQSPAGVAPEDLVLRFLWRDIPIRARPLVLALVNLLHQQSTTASIAGRVAEAAAEASKAAADAKRAAAGERHAEIAAELDEAGGSVKAVSIDRDQTRSRTGASDRTLYRVKRKGKDR